ncbi:DEAD/DEAH box helicase [Streptococcus mitis]|uniref:type I site-specific deoxyribonuclease n=1 Tax=Streptococcus mitis TaxID=28037 RepID=A0AAX2L4A3_STRMT|nr:type I restriction endonuclease [Streptococcus mitis]MBZ2102887.1 DEAD/DEAH box helicase family protein [Streptococcus mitis]OOS17358.1 DEAD/DEAH box helicase [Streptococcus mitis]QBZ12209.1 type I restriction enzyme R N terminus family protein [Streptococcus mitis NCTC 12261]QGS42722.1 type I restriction endonuclease subunit R [Streptococcus mitis]QXA55368.1 DEAD/DEAH box helicase family protein [Streptococcus mitis]
MARRKDFSELTRVQIPAALHLMRMGYTYLSRNSKEIEERDPDTNILVSVFKEQFLTFNNYLTDEDFERELANIKLELDQNDLGRSFFKRIQGQEGAVYIDWENPEANIFHLALEVTCQNGQDEFRPDIVVFINGLPLSYIEVKQPNAIRDGKTGIQSEQDRTRYRFENRKFRRFNNITQLIALSDNLPYISGQGQQKQGSYYGSNAYSKTKFNAFKEEREVDFLNSIVPLRDEQIDFVLEDVKRFALKSQPEFTTNLQPETPCNTFLSSLYQKERLLFMLRFGLVYVEEESKGGQMQLQKHVMRYPQYFATRAIEETIARGIKKGVIWHTQGSGKTALAFFNIRYLTNYFSKQGIVPQFYFVVDRLDLADQAFKEFTKRGLKVKRINNPRELNQKQDGYDVAVVNIQKFKDDSDLTDRSGYDLNRQNIYFIDEAHRSYNERGSYLPNLYQADTNAIKIALTGTPLITYKKDGKTKESHATTRDIFGDYIHKYYYNQSIDDGFTLRLMREDIETSYKDNLRAINEEIQRGDLSKEDIFAHPHYVEPMLDFILEDFNRARDLVFDDQTIGGMIVCDSSKQARELEKQLEERRKAGTTNLTSALILHDEGDKEEKKEKVDAYKEGKIDLIIVYSMLLTGFDAPRLKRLYLGRKIKAHNLLQTLTRVNRPYKDYLFGYVVDFADISKEFDKTNRAYLEELNQEYDTILTGENGEDVFGSLFVPAEEISQELSKTERILMDYPTSNLEFFSQSIDDIKDRKQLNELRKALESVKQYYNIARLLGYDHLIKQIDIAQIATLLNVISRRLLTLSLIDKPDDFSSRTLLNLAMSETSFSFVKIAEEELRLAANDLENLKRRVAGGIIKQRDEKDPEWVFLYEEFQRIMKKHLIYGQEGYTMENIKEIQKEYEDLFRSVENHRTHMRRLTMNFGGDEMAARSYKHVTNSTMVSEYPAVYHVIKDSKVALDHKIGQNQGVLDNEDFFKKMIREVARIAMKTNQSASDLTRQVFNDIVESLFEGYEEEYQH